MRVVRSWGAAAAALIFASACGGGSDGGTRVEGVTTDRPSASSTTTTVKATTTTTTTTTKASADAEVLQAYQSMWNAVRRALNPPDPDLPELAATHTGAALEAVRTQVRGVQAKGAVMRGDVELHPKLISRSDTEAMVEDCIVDRGHLIDPDNGNRLDADQPEVIYNHARTKMARVDGVWKRQSSEQLADSCPPPP